MPTVLYIRSYRFYFFALDCAEPRHVHVSKSGHYDKYWLQPVEQSYNHRFTRSETREIDRLIEENLQLLLDTWNKFRGE